MKLNELFNTTAQVNPVMFQPITSMIDQPLFSSGERVKKFMEIPTNENTNTENYNFVDTKSKESKTIYNSSWENPYKHDKSKWISDMITAYRKIGLNDSAIKNLLAKNALESGWGKYAQGPYNFGNLTAGKNWNGAYDKGTDHDSSGKKVQQRFRAYSNLDEFVRDEIEFLTRLYDFDPDDDFDTFINKLQGNNSGHRKYAAAEDYKNRVRRVYNSI